MDKITQTACEILKRSSFGRGRDLSTGRIFLALKKAGMKVTTYDQTTIRLRYNKQDVVLHTRESTDYHRYGWILVESDIRDEKVEKAFVSEFKRALKAAGAKVAFNDFRLEVYFKPIEDTATADDFHSQEMDGQSQKLIKSKYRAKLDKDDVAQIQYGSEFIERSIAIAKDAKDLIQLINKQRWKGMAMYDTPERSPSEAIKYDKKVKLFWMDTGFFD